MYSREKERSVQEGMAGRVGLDLLVSLRKAHDSANFTRFTVYILYACVTLFLDLFPYDTIIIESRCKIYKIGSHRAQHSNESNAYVGILQSGVLPYEASYNLGWGRRRGKMNIF